MVENLQVKVPMPAALVEFIGRNSARELFDDIQDLGNVRPIPIKNFAPSDALRKALWNQRNLATEPVFQDSFTVEKSYRGPFYQMPFAKVGEWKPNDWLQPEIIDQMKKNGVIKTALFLKKAPILATVKKMKIRHEVPRIEGFLNHVIEPILYDLFVTSMFAMDYGVSLHEKVFKAEAISFKYEQSGVTRTYNDNAIFYKKIKWNNPRTIKEIKIQQNSQDYDGYVQGSAYLGQSTSPNNMNLPGDIEIPVEKSFMWGKGQENSLWGTSDLDAVYEYWYWLELLSGYYMRYLEKLATPPMIGYAPPGTTYSRDENKQVENLSWLAEMLARLQDGMAIVFPSQYDPNSRNRLWDASEMALSSRGDLYNTAISWLELALFKGMFVPDKPVSHGSGTQGNFGSYAMADIQFEAFLVGEEWDLISIVKNIQKYIIRPLLDYNFGIKTADAKIVYPPLSREIKQRVYDVFLQLVDGHPDFDSINFIEIADELGIPVYSETELAEKLAEKVKQAKDMFEATGGNQDQNAPPAAGNKTTTPKTPPPAKGKTPPPAKK